MSLVSLFRNFLFTNRIILREQSGDPATRSNASQVYAKTDKLLYSIDSAGTVAPLGGSGGGDFEVIAATVADTTTTLDTDSPGNMLINGSAVMQVYDLGDATTYTNGKTFNFVNNTIEFVGIKNSDGSTWIRLPPRARCTCALQSNAAAAGVWFSEVSPAKNPSAGYDSCHDYTANFYGAGDVVDHVPLRAAAAGSGARLSAGGAALMGNYAIGEGDHQSGTAVTGTCTSYFPAAGSPTPGFGAKAAEALLIVSALSTAAVEYIARMGFGNSTSGGAPSHGAYIYYDRLSNGDFWAIRIVNGGGNETVVTAVVPPIATPQKLRVEVASDNSRADFWIDNVQVSAAGGLTTNMPTSVHLWFTAIKKSAGAGTTRSLISDYMRVQYYPAVAR